MKSRKLQNSLAALLVVVAVLGLIFQEEIWDRVLILGLKSDSRKVLAEVVMIRKQVQFRLPESLTYYNVKEGMALRAKDTITTGSESTAVLRFNSGLEVEIQPNSLITIEDFSGRPDSLEVSFIKGEIKVVNEKGSSIRLQGDIVKKTKITKIDQDAKSKPGSKAAEISALGLNIEEEESVVAAPIKINIANIERSNKPAKILPKIQIEEKKKRTSIGSIEDDLATFKPKKIIKPKEDKETLPDSYIASVIRSRRTFLDRCYAQHIRLNPDARGRIDTSLKIEPDGSISAARVEASTIADPTLQQCVISTLQRAKFRAFNGDSIIIKYPINFD